MISGAGRSIWKATALMMAEEGADLLLCTRQDREFLEETAHEAESLGVKAYIGLCDAASPDQVQDVVRQGHAYFGHIDVLVNTAVFRSQHPFLDTTSEE